VYVHTCHRNPLRYHAAMQKRINIYVPAQLRAAMLAVPRLVNWSQVCQRAIQRELQRKRNGAAKP
jgi:post-segregation antitoxin (ccd killing protein)